MFFRRYLRLIAKLAFKARFGCVRPIDSMYGNRTPSYNVGYASEEPSPPDPTLVPDRSGTGRHGKNELGISLTASRHICSRLVVPSVC